MSTGLLTTSFGREAARFGGGLAQLLLRLVGFVPSHVLRRALYRLAGMRIGANSFIYGGAEVRSPSHVQIGDHVVVGNRCLLDGRHGISIGNAVVLGTGVWVWTLQHDPQDPAFSGAGGPVVIEELAWIAGRATILPGVTVGRGAVVATGSVVTHDVEPFTMVGGVPARKLGERTRELDYAGRTVKPTPFI